MLHFFRKANYDFSFNHTHHHLGLRTPGRTAFKPNHPKPRREEARLSSTGTYRVSSLFHGEWAPHLNSIGVIMFTLKNLVDGVGKNNTPEMRNHSLGGVEGALETMVHKEDLDFSNLVLLRQILLGCIIMTAMSLGFWGLNSIPAKSVATPEGVVIHESVNRWEDFQALDWRAESEGKSIIDRY